MNNSRIQPTYYPVPDYECVWSQGEKIEEMTLTEKGIIDEIQSQFPRLCDVDFFVDLFDSLRISGVGKVLGYEIETQLNLFQSNKPRVCLLVMSYYGFLRITAENARVVAVENKRSEV